MSEIRMSGVRPSNGFDCDAPTYLIWEGNTMYLPIDFYSVGTVGFQERVAE